MEHVLAQHGLAPRSPQPPSSNDSGYGYGSGAGPRSAAARFRESNNNNNNGSDGCNSGDFSPAPPSASQRPAPNMLPHKIGGGSGGGSSKSEKRAEFLAAMRSAKAVTAHLKAGGSLQDLPPPPPSKPREDLTPCPHCGRRFGDEAAARHIPKCQNTVNKPRPPPHLRSARDQVREIYSL